MSETKIEETTPATSETPEAAPARASKPKKVKATKTAQDEAVRFVRLDTGKDYDKLVLPKDASDPRWQDRLNLPVPEGLISSMVESDDPETVEVVEHKGKYLINNGRTRVRALPEVNKRRKKMGKAPFVLTLAVVPEASDDAEGAQSLLLRSMRANVRMDSPPTILAREVQRALSVDVPEEQICALLGVKGPRLHEYLALLDLPEKVQKRVDDGTISLTAALGLVKLDAAQVEAAAAALEAAARMGKKVTAKDIAKVAGTQDEKVATKGKIKQYLLDSQSWQLAGKHGDAVRDAMAATFEVALGTRSLESLTAALDRLAKGEAVRIDYKAFQTDGKKE